MFIETEFYLNAKCKRLTAFRHLIELYVNFLDISKNMESRKENSSTKEKKNIDISTQVHRKRNKNKGLKKP